MESVPLIFLESNTSKTVSAEKEEHQTSEDNKNDQYYFSNDDDDFVGMYYDL